MTFFQEKLIFLPTTLSQDFEYSFSTPFEELFITTEDDARLNALHFKTENPKGVILYFHGNAGNLDRWGEITSEFTKLQYDVLVMDYRTYGKSTGKLSEKALYDDAQLFYNHLLKTYKEEEIIIYGRSLGTGIASHIASQNKPLKLILETPYFNLLEIAQKRFSFLPIKLLLKYEFPSNEFINVVTCPIAIFHGTNDNVIPFESGRKLFESIIQNEKEFFLIENGEHNNLSNFEAFHNGIQKTLK